MAKKSKKVRQPHMNKYADKILVPNEVRIKAVEAARIKQAEEDAKKKAAEQLARNQRQFDSYRAAAEKKRRERLRLQIMQSGAVQTSPGFGVRTKRRYNQVN